MKNILIDIGTSSHCKAALSDGNGLLAVRRLPRSGLRRSLDEDASLSSPADVVCVSSVAADLFFERSFAVFYRLFDGKSCLSDSRACFV